MKWRNQLLALCCLLLFAAFGVFYFKKWVVQKPFGIILIIGSGLAPDRIAAARIYGGGADSPLALDGFPYTALLKNYSKDFATPDAAAAATALATGVKVPNGSLGADADGKELANLLELARESGRATGLVSNATLTSPTAASFYAHADAKTDRTELARELVEDARIDVVLGGGSADFLPQLKGGNRTDERDLLLEIRRAGYDLVRTRGELEAIPRWRRPKLFGVFNPGELSYAKQVEARADQLSLADMTRRAIELLQYNPGGYLLVIDAGLMGKAARENQGEQTLIETLELDRAIAVATRYVGANSMIIVTGDAGIGGLTLNGAPYREDSGVAVLGVNSAGDPWLTWATGPNGPKPLKTTRVPPGADSPPEAAAPSPAPEVQEPAAVFAESALPTVEDVLAFGTGRGADRLRGTIESTAIFELIRDNL